MGTTGTPISTVTSLTDFLPYLRLEIGDTDSTAYRYLDEWLLRALQASVESLGGWWNFKYLIDESGEIIRNPNNDTFVLDEPTYGIVEFQDKRPIVLMSAFITLKGTLENSAWNLGSWKDAEISFSNIESSRARSGTLKMIWDELTSLLLVPNKRLAHSKKGSLPGYKDNPYEVGK
jgi:hypothetical protein